MTTKTETYLIADEELPSLETALIVLRILRKDGRRKSLKITKRTVTTTTEESDCTPVDADGSEQEATP